MKTVYLLASHAPQVGKSSLAKAMLRILPRARLKSFASPLKEMIYTLLCHYTGLTEAEAFAAVYGDDKEKVLKGLTITARKMMQMLGTEWRIALGEPELWGKLMAEVIKASDDVIIDDFRFPLELEVLKRELPDVRFVTILVRNGAAEEAYRGTHSSEGGLVDFPFDFTVINDMSKGLGHLAGSAGLITWDVNHGS